MKATTYSTCVETNLVKLEHTKHTSCRALDLADINQLDNRRQIPTPREHSLREILTMKERERIKMVVIVQ